MAQMTLNGRVVSFTEGETLLMVARREGVFVPTLCEFAALNHRPGTCRMCLVEMTTSEGKRLVSACDTRALEGCHVDTRSPKVRSHQKLQAELLFMDHCETCSACPRHGACELQQVALQVGLDVGHLSGTLTAREGTDWSATGLTFIQDKCIRCVRCVEVCRQLHGIGAITFEGTGTEAQIGFDGGLWGDSNRCIQCGQCALVCPTGALSVKDQCEQALDWLDDPTVTTVVQFAPATRIAISEMVGAPAGTNLEGQLVAALKRLGADYVMDTRWAADVTIMEEGTELLTRLREAKAKGALTHPDTMFTSCCPGWVNHMEKTHPDLLEHLSSTRSPQQIFGALAKTYLPQKLGLNPKAIRHLSIMPCTAKKGESARENLKHGGERDVDLVLTVQELHRLLERRGIDLLQLAPEPFDQHLMTQTSGAGQLFASTGGVMEAAVRTVSAQTGGPRFGHLPLTPVRGLENTKEASIETEEFGTLRVAVVYGIRSAEKMLDLVKRGESPYHFVEVMACPGGCIGGGGTARGAGWLRTLAQRQAKVYALDEANAIKGAHENPDVQALYQDFLGAPNGHLAHELLHCEYASAQPETPTPSFSDIDRRVRLTKHR